MKKSFFGESSGIKKNLTKPYFIRKNSNRWVWESCAASRKKNVRKVHRNQKNRKELIDYQTLDETFYDQEIDDEEVPDYGDDETASTSPFLYQWHRDQHYDVQNFITKYVDDKMSVKCFSFPFFEY